MEETLVSPAVENYLKAIYLLQAKTGKPAPISKVAERLAVAPASVTEMVQRLARDGLVKHVRYRGVSLTGRGRRAALRVVRRHRLLETFLVERARHGLGGRSTTRPRHSSTRSRTGSCRPSPPSSETPTRDPHGDPIPSAELGDRRGRGGLLDRLPRRRKGASRAHPRRRQRPARLPRRPGRLAGRRGRGARPRALRRPLTVVVWRAQAQPGPARRRRPGCGGH